MVTVTKLPPGPAPAEPVVGQLYRIYSIEKFSWFAKMPNENWNNDNRNDFDQMKSTLLKASYVLLTKYRENNDGSIEGQILISDKLVDFWIPVIEDHTQYSDLWSSYFITPGYYSF